MDKQLISEHIVRRLTRGVSRDTVIREVCDQTGMDWKQAAALVDEVERGESQSIARGNLPLMIGIGAIIMIGGFLLIGYGLSQFFLPFIDGTLGDLTREVLTLHILENWIYLAEGIVGVAMVAGGGFGIGRAMAAAA